MSDFSPEQLRVLRAMADGMLRGMGGVAPAANGGSAPAPTSSGGGTVAPDSDLDGQYGDPQIKFSPRKWAGANYVGSTYSQTEPDFLDVVAEALEWSANNPKPAKLKYADYDRRDAARARGWAARLRASGVTAPAPAPAAPAAEWSPPDDGGQLPMGDDEIPFARSCDSTPRHLRRRARWERF